jgi:arabinofuranosyltransferase
MKSRSLKLTSTPAKPGWSADRRVLAVLGGLIVVAGEFAYAARYRLGPIDDAYIHLRVAHNLASAAGPVFNVGERVEVTSSPLWTLLLGGLLALGGSEQLVLVLLSTATALALGATTALLGFATAGSAAALIAPILLALLPSYAAWTGSGMETPLALFGLALTALSALRARTTADVMRTCLLAGFLVYVRPESCAWIPSFLGIAVWSLPAAQRPRAAVSGLLAWLAPLALLFCARFAYFHEWLPNTYYAKVANGGLAQRLHGLKYVGTFLLQHAPYCAAAVFALRSDNTRVRQLGLICANVLLSIVWAGGDGFQFARLTLPVLPLVCCMAAAALAELRRAAALRPIAVAAVCVVQVLWIMRGTTEFSKYAGSVAFAENTKRIALRMRSLPEGAIATVGIGAIGYFTERRILDLVGLADKHIARAKRIASARIGHDHVDIDYVLGRQPELVLPLGWLRDTALTDETELAALEEDAGSWASALALVRDPRFRARYVARDYETEGKHLRVWLRADIARKPAAEPSAEDH